MRRRLGTVGAVVVAAVLGACVAGGVGRGDAQEEGQPCEATKTGDLLIVDLATCVTSTTSTTTTAPTTSTVEPSTSTSSSTTVPSTSTSTTAPPATTDAPTTAASTTSVAPVPSSSTSSTAPAPSTSPPSSGAAFSEDFATPGAFQARFDFGIAGGVSGFNDWSGDHDMSCGDPAATHRTIHQDNGKDASEVFYQCAPGGDPAKAHVMSAINTDGYVTAWFSPKPTFTNIERVCWAQNLTELNGGKWTQVVFLDADEVDRSPNNLGYTSPEFPNQSLASPPRALGPHTEPGAARAGIKISGGGDASMWSLPAGADANSADSEARWNQFASNSLQGMFAWTNFPTTQDKAERYRICVTDNDNGTTTMVVNRGAQGGGARVLTSTVARSIPDGPVRVVFEDDNYDPPKRGGYDPAKLTWHWDDIEVST